VGEEEIQMSRAIRLALNALVAAGLATSVSAQAPASPSLTRQVDEIFSTFKADGPGCAVAVYQNGSVVLAKGYGSANLEYGVPITPATPFIVGSLSKQFTAAAIALLVEEKRLALTDDVRKYVPELADYGTPITIDHLVHHTSGLRDWWELVGIAGLRYDDTYAVQDVLDMTARQHGLNFTPGERYVYSNTGYIVLGLVVQRVTGKSLREFAAERIFGPLQMANSHYQDDHTQPVRGRAYAYSPEAGGRHAINVWNNDLVGQGGVMTTVLDLAKWDANFDTGAVGGPGFLKRQLERGTLNSGTRLTYAFGVTVDTYRGVDLIEHSGSTGGYRAVLTRFPKQHTSIAVLCNVSNAAPTTLAHRVADYLLRDSFTAPVPAANTTNAAAGGSTESARPNVEVPATALAPFAGRYYSDELDVLYEIAVSGSTLTLKRPRAAPEILTARDAVTFTSTVGRLRFTLGADGRAGRFVLDAGRVQNLAFVRR
jgi:CubicO group peptidase (beta-lactamase class C family)